MTSLGKYVTEHASKIVFIGKDDSISYEKLSWAAKEKVCQHEYEHWLHTLPCAWDSDE